ncbi:MAG: tetratricopeptide repeat protein [Alphaproteobacteria bacterium]|nr:tetratricopeptide repeat protein [Alphaproteobacteria bacterium]
MKEFSFILPEEIYKKHLTTVEGVKFSKREIDIISCILNGRTAKGIAHLLSISPRTSEVHTYNIMKKLNCSSRESVITKIEASNSLFIIKNYYLRLLTYMGFEQVLKDISKLIGEEKHTCLLAYWKGENNLSIIQYIKKHLELAKIKVFFERREKKQPFSQLIEQTNFTHYSLYYISKDSINIEDIKINFSSIIGNNSSLLSNVLFFSFDKKIIDLFSHSINAVNFINFNNTLNYYFFVFEILKIFFPQRNFSILIENFEKKYKGIIESHKNEDDLNKRTIEKNLLTHIKKAGNLKKELLFLGLISIGGLTYLKIKTDPPKADLAPIKQEISEETIKAVVRSDLSLPNEAIFLNRHELITQIDKKLNNQTGIQTIALIGIGGAGKTILARQYARKRKASVIWEVNAETHENLQESFSQLADILSKNEEDQKLVREINETKNLEEREKKLIQFVKNHLKELQDWIIIFDNVAKLAEIQRYFPQDAATWGRGMVLLTTRNSSLQNNKYISSTLFVNELTPIQKLKLFTHIMNNGDSYSPTFQQTEEIKDFLRYIPSFPLDISIAAYYLKNSNISYKEYLENLKINSQEFEDIQKDLLKEASDYTKTRKDIITLSLQQVIAAHKNFGDLLLFVSLIDSQNVPRDLLNAYKDKVTIDNFICHLNKYSLVTFTSASDSFPIFSIHPCTHTISLNYFKETLLLEKNKKYIHPIVNLLDGYIDQLIDKEDFGKIRRLVSHYESFLRHDNFLTNEEKGIIKSQMGIVYFYLGYFTKAKKAIEESLMALSDEHRINNRKAKNLMFLGIIYRELSNCSKSKEFLKKAIKTYERCPESIKGLVRALTYLGAVYREEGNYEKAKILLENSLQTHKKYFLKDKAELARLLVELGNIYIVLGDYEKAKRSLENSVIIYKNLFPNTPSSVAWSLAHLSNAYKGLGDYKKAKALLEESLIIYKKYFPEHSFGVAWVSARLGIIYKDLGNYERASDLLEKSLRIHKQLYGDESIRTAWVSAHLGSICNILGFNEKAKNFLEKSLEIHEKLYGKDNIKTAWILTKIGRLYESTGDYHQACLTLEESAKIYKRYFKENHLKREKLLLYLGNAYTNLGDYHKAQHFLEKTITTYEKRYGKNHVELAQVLRSLGRVYLIKGQSELAETYFYKALNTLKANEHPDMFIVLEDFANLYLKKHTESKIKEAPSAKEFKIKAMDSLQQALSIVQNYFAEGSPHIMKIQSQIKKLEEK